MITKSKEDNRNNNSDDNSVEYTVMMKGAPEVLIKHCTHIMHASGNEELDDDSIAEFKVL
jgi:magnesium-transporting ATPase (P-type)